MSALLELIFNSIFFDFVIRVGVYVRWCLKALFNKITGRASNPFKVYAMKFSRERHPSNIMSDHLINIGLGFSIIGSFFYLLVLLLG